MRVAAESPAQPVRLALLRPRDGERGPRGALRVVAAPRARPPGRPDKAPRRGGVADPACVEALRRDREQLSLMEA